jgi:hypothetical protein
MALFKQAAEVGHAPSQQEVGLRLLSGLGAKVDALLNPVLNFKNRIENPFLKI